MVAVPSKRRRRTNFDRRVLWFALFTGLPGGLASFLLLWLGSYSTKTRWTLAALILISWISLAFSLRERVVRPLQTLANVLSALREGDYSLRARGASPDDSMGEAMLEANALGETIRNQRLGALEATALLRKVMEVIDVAVFAFDEHERLQLINRAGERLLGQPSERLLGLAAQDLSLGDCLEGEQARTLSRTFPGDPAGINRWGMSRSMFRERGLPHQLLVISDLSRALREEERQAWQRLVRVLGHELNNSLAPINSMAGSLESLLVRQPRPDDWQDDMKRGLRVIAGRSEALSRFMAAYAQLAKLPKPVLAAVDVGAWVRRVAALENRVPIRVGSGPEMVIQGDADQLEQLLINLLRNAADAALETKGAVSIEWARNRSHLLVRVLDEGPGLANTTNLFVPFFTTKPGGSGIGLALSRQIAEAHGGTLMLENRRDRRGCRAVLSLALQWAPKGASIGAG